MDEEVVGLFDDDAALDDATTRSLFWTTGRWSRRRGRHSEDGSVGPDDDFALDDEVVGLDDGAALDAGYDEVVFSTTRSLG